MFAARGRMLEYTLELEGKIAQAKLGGDNTGFVMAFCGAGFHWRRDELEDFVSEHFLEFFGVHVRACECSGGIEAG